MDSHTAIVLLKLCGGWVVLSLLLSLAIGRILTWLDTNEDSESEY